MMTETKTQLEIFSNYIKQGKTNFVLITDPAILKFGDIKGLKNGDVDDLVAMIASIYLKSFSDIENVYFYIPVEKFNDQGNNRFTLIKNLKTKAEIFDTCVITDNSDGLNEIFAKTAFFGYCAPVSTDDKILIDHLNMRKLEDNLLNYSQGESFNVTINGPDYNFLTSNVDSWKDPNNSKQMNNDLLKRLFPTQYKSSYTNIAYDPKNLINSFPLINEIVDIISVYGILKLICVPSPTLSFAGGLYCPMLENAKANNMKQLIAFFHENKLFVDHEPCLSELLNDKTFLIEQIKLLANVFDQTNVVIFKNVVVKSIDKWVEIFTFNKHISIDVKNNLTECLKVIVLFMSINKIELQIIDTNIDKEFVFPTIDTCEIIQTEYILPNPILFDYVALISHILLIFKNYPIDMNHQNDKVKYLDNLTNQYLSLESTNKKTN